MDLRKNAAVTDCTIKLYKMDISYVSSNRDSHYDRKTSASNPFMLQFVKIYFWYYRILSNHVNNIDRLAHKM